jgi:hypothetical protein
MYMPDLAKHTPIILKAIRTAKSGSGCGRVTARQRRLRRVRRDARCSSLAEYALHVHDNVNALQTSRRVQNTAKGTCEDRTPGADRCMCTDHDGHAWEQCRAIVVKPVPHLDRLYIDTSERGIHSGSEHGLQRIDQVIAGNRCASGSG